MAEETKQAQVTATPEKAPAQDVKPQAEKAKQPAAEKQTNCLGCNKPIRKLKRYYRDGKMYCNKKCWRDYIAKAKTEKK